MERWGNINVYRGCFIVTVTVTALAVVICLSFNVELRKTFTEPLLTTSSKVDTRLYNHTTNSLFNQSFTDLLPRSAYFDSRPRDGHDNATVILVHIIKTAIREKRVIGCGVDEHYTTKDFNFQVHVLGMFHWVHKRYPSLTHDDGWVICYNLPAIQGSRTFVIFNDKTRGLLTIETERSLYISSPVTPQSYNSTAKWKSSILVCTTLYGTPPWLREWLVYQKTIGVDFIHLYAQESFIAEGGANNSVLQSYLKSGYAKFDVWKAYLNESQDFYHQQPLLYVDCIYRYRTEFDYALLYDTDDFFVPLIPGETNIHYYANRLFHDDKVGSVAFKWSVYFPDCGLTTRPEDIKDGNVTQHLALKTAIKRNENKSMHRLSALVEVHIPKVVKLLPGYISYGSSLIWGMHRRATATPDIAYVAHIRKFTKPWHDKELLQECRDCLKKYS